VSWVVICLLTLLFSQDLNLSTDLPGKESQASVFKSCHLGWFDFTFKPNNLVGLVVMPSLTLKEQIYFTLSGANNQNFRG